jgi:hypothetical protein
VEYADWGPYNYNAASDWVLITIDPQVLAFPALQETATHVLGQVHANPAITRIEALHGDAPLWTDSFSNVWQVMEPWWQEEPAEVEEEEFFLDE